MPPLRGNQLNDSARVPNIEQASTESCDLEKFQIPNPARSQCFEKEFGDIGTRTG